MSLFDQRPREPDAGAMPGDPAFGYLDRSGRPEAARVRAFLEDAFERYPTECQKALAARLRDEAEHLSAFFELLVHEWCLCVGIRILAVEAQVRNGRAPDFLAECADGLRFHLECVVARGLPDAAVKTAQRRALVLRALEGIGGTRFPA